MISAGTDVAGLASRRAAYRAVRRVHVEDAYASPAVDAALRTSGLVGRDRAFAANLAFSTLRWQGTLDWALGHVVKRPLDQVESTVLDVLRMGAWQIGYGNIPDRAAVATSVELAKVEVAERAGGFVNGVLRALARAWPDLAWPSEDSAEGLGLATGYPAWIVNEARARFGGHARAVLEAGNEPPGLTLRAAGDPQQLLAELADAGLDAQPGQHAPEAVRVPGADPGVLDAVAEGRATPQDEASILVGRALCDAVGPGALVVDSCAGPGGKSTHLAELGLRVIALELRPTRARLVAGGAARLGLSDRVHVAAADASVPPLPHDCADAVLVDAPCTGLGVVRRRPDLRWRRMGADPAELAELQAGLLDAAARMVKPGGVVVYSACTWTVAETTATVHRFLDTHADFSAEPVALGSAGMRLPGDPGVQLNSATDRTDGMYVACLRSGPSSASKAAVRGGKAAGERPRGRREGP